jgi:hypothetical protein
MAADADQKTVHSADNKGGSRILGVVLLSELLAPGLTLEKGERE